MSRVRRYTHSVVSGYVLLGFNAIYTLASIPLALSYLTKPEFALWAITTTIAQYVALLDMGMSGTSRILVDHKDNKDEGAYGSVIQTFLLVSAAQAAIILMAGVGLAFLLGPVLKIPAGQAHEFIVLTIGQCVVLAATFMTRILLYLAGAHQRYDVANYIHTGGLLLGLLVLWAGFACGAGVYSTLWAQAAGWAFVGVGLAAAALKLNFLPARGCWGRPTWARFCELFAYGRDIFLIAVGYQLLNASPALIVTRVLGIEAAAVWSVCTRAYFFLSQIIYRLLDFSAPMMAEMMVRGENDQLRRRFKSLLIASISLSILAGVLFTGCNEPFLRIWTHGKMQWPAMNDALLALWLVLLAGARFHIGLIGQAKVIGRMRYVYMIEGVFFAGASLVTCRLWGVAGMVATGIVGTLFISWPYGSWRSSQYFRLPWQTVAVAWCRAPALFGVLLGAWAAVVGWLVKPLPDLAYLGVFAGLVGGAGLPLLYRLGLDEDLRQDLARRIANRFNRRSL